MHPAIYDYRMQLILLTITSFVVVVRSLALSRIVLHRYGARLPLLGSLSMPSVLRSWQYDVKYEHNYKHNDQEPHHDNEDHPPHPGDPINHLLKACRVEKKVHEAIERSIVVYDHALLEKIAVAGKVFTRKADLQMTSFSVGKKRSHVRVGNVKGGYTRRGCVVPTAKIARLFWALTFTLFEIESQADTTSTHLHSTTTHTKNALL